jgi:hypothetical protein
MIAIETLTSDTDGHKAGSAVYRIPQDTASRIQDFLGVNGLQALYSSYLTQMLSTVEMKGKREGGCHLMLFVFAHGPLIVEARWVTAAKAR